MWYERLVCMVGPIHHKLQTKCMCWGTRARVFCWCMIAPRSGHGKTSEKGTGRKVHHPLRIFHEFADTYEGTRHPCRIIDTGHARAIMRQ